MGSMDRRRKWVGKRRAPRAGGAWGLVIPSEEGRAVAVLVRRTHAFGEPVGVAERAALVHGAGDVRAEQHLVPRLDVERSSPDAPAAFRQGGPRCAAVVACDDGGRFGVSDL